MARRSSSTPTRWCFRRRPSIPNQPINPEVAKNGNIYNIWTLNLKNGELKQFTDALGGNVSPIPLRTRTSSRRSPSSPTTRVSTASTRCRRRRRSTPSPLGLRRPGPIIDFQPPLSHTLVKQNERDKGKFEKLFLEGRPPVNVGVTSGGDFFGGTAVTFTDVLGDQQFNLYAESVSQYRSLSLSYTNLSRRFQYALQGFSLTQFYYGNYGGYLYDPSSSSVAIRRWRRRPSAAALAFAIYPMNRYARLELSAGIYQFEQKYNDDALQFFADQYQQQLYGRPLFANGTIMPLGAAYVRETTVFREYGPLSGETMRVGYEIAPPVGGFLSRQTADVDARKYIRLATNGVLAFRFRGFNSWGDYSDYLYFGGNSELRGYDYLEFLGSRAFFADAELRFPLIEAALTPIGVVGGLRAVGFFNFGGASPFGQPIQVWTKHPTHRRADHRVRAGSEFAPGRLAGLRAAADINGFRLVDSRASYGIGLETFALGFPIHFDWSWRTMFNKDWEDIVYDYQALSDGDSSGSHWLRKPKFSVWIGYDF